MFNLHRHHDITIYYSLNSKMSELARTYFKSEGFEANEICLDANQDIADHIYDLTGQKKGPVVEIDGRFIVGYRPELYDFALTEKPKE